MNNWIWGPHNIFGKIWRFVVPNFTVKTQIDGIIAYISLRDNPIYLLPKNGLIKEVRDILSEPCNTFWDIGCNVGLFSLMALKKGKRVIALDVSTAAIRLLTRTAKENFPKGDLLAISRPLATQKYKCEHNYNTMFITTPTQSETGTNRSLVWYELADRYGIPDLIKMDIEGGEVDFFNDQEFKRFVVRNKIIWAVEIHTAEAWSASWIDVPYRVLDSRHIVYNSRKV